MKGALALANFHLDGPFKFTFKINATNLWTVIGITDARNGKSNTRKHQRYYYRGTGEIY